MTCYPPEGGKIPRRMIESYVGILEDLLMAFRLTVFRKRAKRATVARDSGAEGL